MQSREHGHVGVMYTGMSIFLLALGAILKFAVTFTIAGISLQAVGVILMIVGVVGLIASFIYPLADRRGDRRGRHDVTRVARERDY